MMWSDFVGYVSRVSKSIHTTTLSFGLYIYIFDIISAIINIKDDKDVWYFMKKPFGAPIISFYKKGNWGYICVTGSMWRLIYESKVYFYIVVF